VIELDQRLTRIKDLIETKERVDAELEELIGGSLEKRKRSPQKGSNCEQEGHTARNCPAKMPAVTI
jgi:zinc knuckle protein